MAIVHIGLIWRLSQPSAEDRDTYKSTHM